MFGLWQSKTLRLLLLKIKRSFTTKLWFKLYYNIFCWGKRRRHKSGDNDPQHSQKLLRSLLKIGNNEALGQEPAAFPKAIQVNLFQMKITKKLSFQLEESLINVNTKNSFDQNAPFSKNNSGHPPFLLWMFSIASLSLKIQENYHKMQIFAPIAAS